MICDIIMSMLKAFIQKMLPAISNKLRIDMFGRVNDFGIDCKDNGIDLS